MEKAKIVDQFVLKPNKEELTPLFGGLTIRKKYDEGRGKLVIAYVFAWEASVKTLRTCTSASNGELTDKEKWRALDKVRAIKLGTTEQEYLAKKQKEHDEEIAKKAKQEVLGQLKNNWH